MHKANIGGRIVVYLECGFWIFNGAHRRVLWPNKHRQLGAWKLQGGSSFYRRDFNAAKRHGGRVKDDSAPLKKKKKRFFFIERRINKPRMEVKPTLLREVRCGHVSSTRGIL